MSAHSGRNSNFSCKLGHNIQPTVGCPTCIDDDRDIEGLGGCIAGSGRGQLGCSGWQPCMPAGVHARRSVSATHDHSLVGSALAILGCSVVGEIVRATVQAGLNCQVPWPPHRISCQGLRVLPYGELKNRLCSRLADIQRLDFT